MRAWGRPTLTILCSDSLAVFFFDMTVLRSKRRTAMGRKLIKNYHTKTETRNQLFVVWSFREGGSRFINNNQ